ncbi:DUF2752 domain-containing protein [Nocardia spumae]|uniref:DUF2752 domain-containing protein n=1 Tax=Nocardia spumae TaxID=2887190 RepID=UPI001D151F59|nr:DUF2752 domain-containing protein [Nocardia spumae]
MDIAHRPPAHPPGLRTGWRTVGMPLLVAGAAVGAATVLHVRDPHTHGSYGLCPFYELTGWWCPGCGGLRAVHNLTEGRLVDALHSNVFLLPLLLTLVLWWGRWAVGRWRGRSETAFPFTLGGRAQWWLIGALVVFTVIRNMPFGTWLAPV